MRPGLSYRSSRRSNGSDTPLFVTFIAVILIVGFIFGIDRISGGIVRGYARAGGGALMATVSSATGAITGSGLLASKRSLEEENQALAAGIAARDQQAARFAALQDENDALRAMANLASTHPDGITVPVISSFGSSPFGVFTIGAGSQSGIREGDIVLTPGGFVLGTIASVALETASVDSLFAPGKELEVRAGDVAFTLSGRGGGNARAQAPRTAAIAAGNAVLAPLFEDRPVGIIGNIEAASSSASATLSIRVPVNLDTLRFVYIIPHTK